jgi:hypothetical protein
MNAHHGHFTLYDRVFDTSWTEDCAISRVFVDARRQKVIPASAGNRNMGSQGFSTWSGQYVLTKTAFFPTDNVSLSDRG